MKVVVVNQKTMAPVPPAGVYRIPCHRPHPLGNPTAISPTMLRASAILRFRLAFKELYETQYRPILLGHLAEAWEAKATTIELVCHCAPLPCHAEVIAEYLRKEIQEMSRPAPAPLPGKPTGLPAANLTRITRKMKDLSNRMVDYAHSPLRRPDDPLSRKQRRRINAACNRLRRELDHLQSITRLSNP